jgi:hypothetical protein
MSSKTKEATSWIKCLEPSNWRKNVSVNLTPSSQDLQGMA